MRYFQLCEDSVEVWESLSLADSCCCSAIRDRSRHDVINQTTAHFRFRRVAVIFYVFFF